MQRQLWTAAGTLATSLAMLGRNALTTMIASALVILILIILIASFDLDRPERGLIKIPSSPLVDVRDLMDQPPAVGG